MSVGMTGAAWVAGVVGSPINHSLSPVIHNAWIEEALLDAAYVPFNPPPPAFRGFIQGLRGGAIRGLNVTIPFKEEALALADEASDLARRAGAANLLLFRDDGAIIADNTDGTGLLAALHVQAEYRADAGPVVILGAGGAARGAAAALLEAGAPAVRVINRTRERALVLARQLGPLVTGFGREDAHVALRDAACIINATSLGLGGGPGPDIDLGLAPHAAVVMDMVYKPLETGLIHRALERGMRTVDGLEMLIRQAVPSFEAFYGRRPPATINVRALCLETLAAQERNA
ncbi:shikimate dehydrogenase [Caulobacter ginsengisoli]|uniref:Shikimate dehydrogenase (NADP(+)) n=1 Tax=Caulobacter ginsengisoli TaxID=400775 RepID=A0ABU0ITG0_9CAUL|nr:shikimate dehydrogenase [Caulobacter ginsengisoli]MDQ0465291.1 shikimate dehydrogenase [Caulobacter ginsengisoli]